jgi:hypothetical protein
MTADDRVRGAKRAAAARLHAIPGVHAVGVGFKVVGGKKTDELAITVFVDKKRKPEELTEDELVPTEIEGVKTDVVQMERTRSLNADPNSVTVTTSPLPPNQGTSGGIVTLSGTFGKTVPGDGLVVIVYVTVQPAGGDATETFGYAEANGVENLVQLAGELANSLLRISGLDATASSTAPATITIKPEHEDDPDDEAEIKITQAFTMAADVTKYFPDWVRGGIAIEPGGYPGPGTLGCLATTAPTEANPQGTVVGLTNFHVVCPSSDSYTTLDASTDNAAPTIVTFTVDTGKPVTPGTLVALTIKQQSKPKNILFSAFYTTLAEDTTPDQVAAKVVAAAGVAAAAANPSTGITVTQVTTHPTKIMFSGVANARMVCLTFGPPNSDDTVKLLPTVTKTGPTTSTIEFDGSVAAENYGIFVRINPGGARFTFGSFTNPAKGQTPTQVAAKVAQAIQDVPDFVPPGGTNALRGNVTASSTGTIVTVTSAEEVECRVVSDIQVGQPDRYFGSTCSHCCSHRIGRVVDAQVHSDVALIQLDPGLKYKLEIQDIAGAIDVISALPPDIGLAVQKRGRTSGLTQGKVTYVEVSEVVTDKGFLGIRGGEFWIEPDADSAPNNAFTLEGDSGSAVISSIDNSLVGLLWGNSGEIAAAMEIGPLIEAFPALKLSFAPAPGVDADTVQVVPKPAAAAFQALADDAAQAVTIPEAAPLGFAATRFAKRLDQAENEIRATPLGREYVEVVRQHLQEGFTLVNKNRRVATVWRRSGGPEILDALARMIQLRNERLPAEINGKPLVECLSRIQRIVTRYGSPAFSEALNRYAPKLEGLAHMTYLELLAALQSEAME